MSQRAKRHELIRAILASTPVQSQDELQSKLSSAGVSATQATLSRDLKELGVAKGPLGYVLLEDGEPVAMNIAKAPSVRLIDVVESYVIAVEPAVGMVVVRTGPGQAQIVGVELDRRPVEGVAGTIAGDDTIFIALSEGTDVHDLVDALREMAGLDIDASIRATVGA